MIPRAILLRPADAADLPAVIRLIHGLAACENLPVTATEDDLCAALFGPTPRVHAVLAERANLYLEDIFVDPAHRGAGVGRALFRHLARIVLDRGFGRMEWSLQNSNQPARHFYQSIGAVPLAEWTLQRLSGPALTALAASEDPQHG